MNSKWNKIFNINIFKGFLILAGIGKLGRKIGQNFKLSLNFGKWLVKFFNNSLKFFSKNEQVG